MDQSARNDAVASILIFVIIGVFASVTGQIFVDPMDPGFSARDFPIGVLALLSILALVLFGRSLRRLAATGWKLIEPGEFRGFLHHLAPIVALGFFYVWLIETFQYALPTFFTLAGALALYGNKGTIRLAVVPFIVTILFYVLFYGIFGLNEASGTLWSYDNELYFRPLRKLLRII